MVLGGNRSFGFRNLRSPSRWEFLQGRVPHPVQESVALRQPLKVKESVCLLLQVLTAVDSSTASASVNGCPLYRMNYGHSFSTSLSTSIKHSDILRTNITSDFLVKNSNRKTNCTDTTCMNFYLNDIFYRFLLVDGNQTGGCLNGLCAVFKHGSKINLLNPDVFFLIKLNLNSLMRTGCSNTFSEGQRGTLEVNETRSVLELLVEWGQPEGVPRLSLLT
ncbi:hypothetical protein CEXT_805371 [Caerostris extrusa]|uniref:Uncharacterized protein n=1 Tax=Caerostris extrusa TaxID=172846 RepID=A0AAV4W4Q7_CAEEX|nr:hypothetical protein CEXT_805371 [Caerostris extrusa]